MDGGVSRLLGLIRDHRGAVEYDLRHRFQLGLRDVGDRLTIFEAARLIEVVGKDPSSAVSAAVAGWEYPISREAAALLDLYDLTFQANSDPKKGRPKPHPGRPFPMDDRDRKRYGDTGGRSRAEVVEILNALGHTLPV